MTPYDEFTIIIISSLGLYGTLSTNQLPIVTTINIQFTEQSIRSTEIKTTHNLSYEIHFWFQITNGLDLLHWLLWLCSHHHILCHSRFIIYHILLSNRWKNLLSWTHSHIHYQHYYISYTYTTIHIHNQSYL